MPPEVGLSQGYVRQALHHLVRSGWLVRLRKGLYALSSAVPAISVGEICKAARRKSPLQGL